MLSAPAPAHYRYAEANALEAAVRQLSVPASSQWYIDNVLKNLEGTAAPCDVLGDLRDAMTLLVQAEPEIIAAQAPHISALYSSLCSRESRASTGGF